MPTVIRAAYRPIFQCITPDLKDQGKAGWYASCRTRIRKGQTAKRARVRQLKNIWRNARKGGSPTGECWDYIPRPRATRQTRKPRLSGSTSGELSGGSGGCGPPRLLSPYF